QPQLHRRDRPKRSERPTLRGQQLSLTTSGLFPKAVLLRTAGTAASKEEAMGQLSMVVKAISFPVVARVSRAILSGSRCSRHGRHYTSTRARGCVESHSRRGASLQRSSRL